MIDFFQIYDIIFIERKKGCETMGMDAYIFRAKTKKAFEKPNWYDDENSDITEVWYARRFWDLVNQVSFIKDINKDRGEYIKLTKDNIEEMLYVASHNPDYWDGFDTVPDLCKILYNFDDDKKDGWNYYFEFDD